MRTTLHQPPVSTHFSDMMGPLGLYQHANHSQPRLEEGYCTDDNARAVQLLVEWQDNWRNTSANMTSYFERCWQFLILSQMPNGRFRNFRSLSGEWLDRGESEDTQARTARALTTIMASSTCSRQQKTQAEAILTTALPQLWQLSYPRSMAETIIALAGITSKPATNTILAKLWKDLWQRWKHNTGLNWPWPEPHLTYANALLPHGLLAGANALKHLNNPVRETLKMSVSFLINLTTHHDYFLPISTAGHHQRNRIKTLYDQQPIEAQTMLDLLITYHPFIRPSLTSAVIQAPYRWFLGTNSQNISLIDSPRGACYDGLTRNGVNQNQGAESLLAYLRSELLMTRYQQHR